MLNGFAWKDCNGNKQVCAGCRPRRSGLDICKIRNGNTEGF
jgi:hypothetical protein